MSEQLKNICTLKNKISLVSLGCPKNLVDSDNLIRKLISNGFSYLYAPEDADILLINTCGFIEDAKKESIEEILKLCEIKNGSKKLIVFGCLAKRYIDELVKEIPEIDAIYGVGEDEKIVEYCKNLMDQRHGDTETRRNKNLSLHPFTYSPIHRVSSYAYLKIAEGCNKKCLYCVIPSIRGDYRSIPRDDILKEAERLIKTGVKELILVAQDTACYGKELNKYDITALLKDLCLLNGDFWIRLLYAYPSSIDDSLLDVISQEDKICKYIDIPFQHSEDRILKMMGRRGNRKDYLSLIEKIRDKIPAIILRTTFIVGFPSETEEEFNSLISFIEEMQFDRLGVFKYSKEEGTPASRLKGHLSKTIKDRRFDEIIRRQSRVSLEKNKKLISRQFKAIVDEVSDGIAIARLYSHAPEIDGVVIIERESRGQGVKGSSEKFNRSLEPLNPPILESFSFKIGDFITVEIIDAFDYDLKGILV